MEKEKVLEIELSHVSRKRKMKWNFSKYIALPDKCLEIFRNEGKKLNFLPFL
jgi:hypothetical protein